MTLGQPQSANLHPGPGFRVRLEFARLDASLMQAFLRHEVPDISDALNRLYALDPEISCQTNPEHRLCGPVCTVRVFPGDNLMIHKILDVAEPGDVVVVGAQGDRCPGAVIGDAICTKAKHRGIAGFVIDGLVRDLPRIQALDLPVFARGTTAVGPLHRGPGEINYPIACGGTVFSPGDVLVADASGIVVVPRDAAEELLDRLESDREVRKSYEAELRRGHFSNEWVNEQLRRSRCPIYRR